jgi:hypothetical protein
MVRLNVPKDESLEVVLRKFEKSKKGQHDYMELFVVFFRCIRPDNGLTWERIEEIIVKVLSEREVKSDDN